MSLRLLALWPGKCGVIGIRHGTDELTKAVKARQGCRIGAAPNLHPPTVWTFLNKVDSTFEIYQRYRGGLNETTHVLQGDADGNGTADMEMTLTNVSYTSLDQSDFTFYYETESSNMNA